jgi:hypothetical protein
MTRILPMPYNTTRISMDLYADCVQFGGWRPFDRQFEPVRFIEAAAAFGFGTQTQYALDCITLAVEAGFFTTRDAFKKAVFATGADFAAFCQALETYPWWLNERHFYAFMALLNYDEHGVRTYADLARELREEFGRY